MKKGIHIVNLNKQQQKYVTVLLFILYSLGVHVESPKYKMICLKSQNQVNLQKNKQKKVVINS